MIEALLCKNACLFTYFVLKLRRFVVRTLKNLLNIGKSCVFPTSSWTAAFPESFKSFKRFGVETGSNHSVIILVWLVYWRWREKKNRQYVTACDSGWIENQKVIAFEKIIWVKNRVYHENKNLVLSNELIKPNFCFDLSHRRSTTVSLETRNLFITKIGSKFESFSGSRLFSIASKYNSVILT